jgi:anti-sigma B factor antagonist
VHKSDTGSPNADQESVDEQVVRIDTARVVHNQQESLLLRVAGEIDEVTIDRFRAAVGTGLDQLPAGGTLVLDLSGVTFLGSPGLQALVNATRAASWRGEPLRIVVDANRSVIRPIRLTGLDDVLALFPSVEEALQRG